MCLFPEATMNVLRNNAEVTAVVTTMFCFQLKIIVPTALGKMTYLIH